MSGTEATLYEIRNGAAWITLNRPENRNALSAILVTELFDHITASNANDDVRCIVITGNGPTFCAGADLKSTRTAFRRQRPGSAVPRRAHRHFRVRNP